MASFIALSSVSCLIRHTLPSKNILFLIPTALVNIIHSKYFTKFDNQRRLRRGKQCYSIGTGILARGNFIKSYLSFCCQTNGPCDHQRKMTVYHKRYGFKF